MNVQQYISTCENRPVAGKGAIVGQLQKNTVLSCLDHTVYSFPLAVPDIKYANSLNTTLTYPNMCIHKC